MTPHPLRDLMFLIVVAMVATGCNSGKRNTTVPPIIISCASGDPFIIDVSSNVGCVGEELILEVLNVPLELDRVSVSFVGNTDGVAVEGLIRDIVDTGVHPAFDCPSARLTVQVPTGVRSGYGRLRVRLPDGEVRQGAQFAFDACPEIIGFAVGNDGDAHLAYGAGFVLIGDEFQLYGYNLDDVTSVQVMDPDGVISATATVADGGAATATYTIPEGMDVVTVTLDPAAPFVPMCETYYLDVALTNGSSGAPLTSNHVLVPVRQQEAIDEFWPLPGTITGCVLPSGVRRGVVPIGFNLAMEPAGSRYTVVPQFLDPTTAEWIDCIGVDANEGEEVETGDPDQTSRHGAIVAGGASHVFHWDTVASGLVSEIGDTNGIVTRVRFALRDPLPFPEPSSSCPTSPDPDRLFESPLILIQNPVTSTSPPTPIVSSGVIREDFGDNLYEDPSLPGSADWNLGAFHRLTGAALTGVVPWGSGTSDIVCESGRDYVFNTDTGSITDFTELGNPTPIHSAAAGDPPGVTVLRTLVIEAGAGVSVVGDNPLRIWVSGDGNPSTIACQLHGVIDLRGGDGGGPLNAIPGDGGTGAPGGGDGGNGGSIELAALVEDPVASDVPPTDGGNDGGRAGHNLTFARILDSSSGKGGPGGGGGGRERGGDGLIENDSTGTAPVGRGGPARGDDRVLHLVGGSGGGGGGATLYRGSSVGIAPLVSRAGGGGGGGGGAFSLVVNGSLILTGEINTDGGAGGVGTTGHAGPGGGGSGGSIRLRATGDVVVEPGALLSAQGGAGGSLTTQHGGDGAEGRIRVAAGGEVLVPIVAELDQLVPSLTSGVITFGGTTFGNVDPGTGADGVLDLSSSGDGVYVLDTDNGVLAGPVAGESLTYADLEAAVSAAPLVASRSEVEAWNFTQLVVPADATIRAIGSAPLVIRVTGDCDIDGTIDVSGFDGGIPDLETNPADPSSGAGGHGGPGGGDGGDGGRANGIVAETTNGGNGDLMFLPTALQSTPAMGGASVTSLSDLIYGGSGGGGGHGSTGSAGLDIYGGSGGGVYGTELLTDPTTGEVLPFGGAGGAGGGGSVHAFGAVDFEHTPGTGGGGGGGFLSIAVGGRLVATRDAMFIARGGSSFSPPQGAGGGGAGAGGAVLIQFLGASSVFAGQVDVRGGDHNLLPLGDPYVIASGAAAGQAGDGGFGRVRIETSQPFDGTAPPYASPAASVGPYFGATAEASEAQSLPYSVVMDRAARLGSGVTFATPEVDSTGVGAFVSFVSFEGAHEDPAAPGRPGPFSGPVTDPNLLDAPDYVRMRWTLYTDRTTGLSPEVESIRLEYQE